MSLPIASSQQSYLSNSVTTSNHKPKTKLHFPSTRTRISCNNNNNQQHESKDSFFCNTGQFSKLALVTLAAGILSLGSVGDAAAAKSGGRVGGQAFRSPAPRSAPRINNNRSRTNIYINPQVAPPLGGGYGYGGYGVPFYGGWSPFSYFAPGPSVAVGVGGGFDSLVLFVFLGAAAAVARNAFRSRDEDDEDE